MARRSAGTDHQDAVIILRNQGMTQAAIGARLGISQPAVSKALRRAEHRSPGERTVPRISVIKPPAVRSPRKEARTLAPDLSASVIFEKREPWQRFRNPYLEKLAAAYESAVGRLMLDKGKAAAIACEDQWKTAYGYSDKMASLITAIGGRLPGADPCACGKSLSARAHRSDGPYLPSCVIPFRA